MKPHLFAAIATLAALLTGCAGSPATASGALDQSEAQRAQSALLAFDTLAQTEERYGVYVRGRRVGYMLRERSRRGEELVTVSRIVNETGTDAAEDGTTLTEIFRAAPPHDAILLQQENSDGSAGTRSIRWTQAGYVRQYSVSGRLVVEPMFDFQFRLADALAPQVWLQSGVAMSQCLTYPGYLLSRFSRKFNTECISRLATYRQDGDEIDAIETVLRNGSRIVRERANGRELLNQAGRLGVELRLEPRGIATQRRRPPGPPAARGAREATARDIETPAADRVRTGRRVTRT